VLLDLLLATLAAEPTILSTRCLVLSFGEIGVEAYSMDLPNADASTGVSECGFSAGLLGVTCPSTTSARGCRGVTAASPRYRAWRNERRRSGCIGFSAGVLAGVACPETTYTGPARAGGRRGAVGADGFVGMREGVAYAVGGCRLRRGRWNALTLGPPGVNCVGAGRASITGVLSFITMKLERGAGSGVSTGCMDSGEGVLYFSMAAGGVDV